MSAIRRQVPDFRLSPWKLLRQASIKTPHPHTNLPIYVGHYNIYLNETTGDHGRDIMIVGFRHPYLVVWEKKLKISPARISTLHYAAIYRDGKWQVFRIKANSEKFQLELDQYRRPMNIFVIFTLEIGSEITFPFPYLIV